MQLRDIFFLSMLQCLKEVSLLYENLSNLIEYNIVSRLTSWKESEHFYLLGC